MSASQNPTPDWSKLAQEALDLWQDHLQAYSAHPEMKAELIRLATPQLDVARQMFAEWTGMGQNKPHGAASAATPENRAETPERRSAAPDGGSAHDLAQLARRVAVLERQLAELEDRLGASPLAPYMARPGATANTDDAAADRGKPKRRKTGTA